MVNSRKEEIILATLKLASSKGLKAVSMSMIADCVGIKKPSLYNHFKSKEELVEEMYLYLRNRAGGNVNLEKTEKIFAKNSAYEILMLLVKNYIMISSNKEMEMFYKVIYQERTVSKKSAEIMVEESEKMIKATQSVFIILQEKKLLKFSDVYISALSFAMTIHGLMDYEADKSLGANGEVKRNTDLIEKFIRNFCEEHKA